MRFTYRAFRKARKTRKTRKNLRRQRGGASGAIIPGMNPADSFEKNPGAVYDSKMRVDTDDGSDTDQYDGVEM